MRDFRDAKAMAQTLRDALGTRSVSLKVSESLELIAKILGLPDWNVLAAKIRSAGRGQDRSMTDGIEDAEQVIELSPEVLDRYAGTYQFHNAVFTVSRDDDQLSARLSGQAAARCHAVSETEFVAREIGARLRFMLGANGVPTAVVLNQRGNAHNMQRIDPGAARELQRTIEDRMKNRSASPGTEAALRRLIEGVAAGNPDYAEMSADLADATRKQLPLLQPGLAELGSIVSIEFLGVGPQGQDVYSVWHQGGASHWQIMLDRDGTIISAFVTPGP